MDSNYAAYRPGWQPFPHFEGADLRTFVFEVRFRKESLGVFEVYVRKDRQLDYNGLEKLQTLGLMLEDALTALETVQVGEMGAVPLSGLSQFDSKYVETRERTASMLRKSMVQRLTDLEAPSIVSELKAYVKPSDAIQKVLTGVFLYLGRSQKQLKGWGRIKRQLSADLILEMCRLSSMDATQPRMIKELLMGDAQQKMSRKESTKLMHGINPDDMCDAPLPIQIMFKWLQAATLVDDIQQAAAIESKGLVKLKSQSSKLSKSRSNEIKCPGEITSPAKITSPTKNTSQPKIGFLASLSSNETTSPTVITSPRKVGCQAASSSSRETSSAQKSGGPAVAQRSGALSPVRSDAKAGTVYTAVERFVDTVQEGMIEEAMPPCLRDMELRVVDLSVDNAANNTPRSN